MEITKIVKPQVYGLVLESMGTIFLSMQYAFSLEEAFMLAKLEFEKQNPIRRGANNPLVGSKIGLFAIKSIEELTSSTALMDRFQSVNSVQEIINDIDKVASELLGIVPGSGPTIPVPEVVPEVAPEVPKEVGEKLKKNILMQEIVKSKDMAMFEKHKALFSRAERSYLKEQINKKVNN